MNINSAEIFAVLGFGSAVLLIWLLLLGMLEVSFLAGLGAFVFFILVGFSGVIAEFAREKKGE